MSVELIKYAFSAGELSPSLYGRTDLTKYDLGVALSRNWFVDYRGGLSTRPGTEFLDFIKHDEQDTKLIEFRFSPDLSNIYVLLFGHKYVRFIQDGAYILEADRSFTRVTNGVLYLPANTYANGDWVKIWGTDNPNLNGRSFIVSSRTTLYFTLVDPGTLEEVATLTSAEGRVARIYEIPTPYTAAELENLASYQIRDFVRLTHPDHPVMNLIRKDHTNWTFEEDERYSEIPIPTGLWGTATTPDSESRVRASVVYAVASVNSEGIEGPISFPIRMENIVNFSVEAGSATISWNRVPGIVSYNIYRSHLAGYRTGTAAAGRLSEGTQLGYLGNTRGTQFVDSNVIPDFTKSPVIDYDPFAYGAVDEIEVLSGGSDYPFAAPITVSGGTGFRGFAVTGSNGEISSVIIQRDGQGYTAGSTVSAAGGTGATFKLTVRNTRNENNPSISTLFQQRQMYAASLENPLTLWGSQIRRYNIFTDDGTDSGGYEFELDSSEVAPIRHMLAMRGGLLLMSQTGIWLLTGSPQGGAVTPSNALADPQDYTGVSAVSPLKIGTDLLYIEGKGNTVRLLSYNDFSKVYSGEDQSILSSHLFKGQNRIIRWTFADNPYKMVKAVRSDGALLMFTIVKEQDVFAWTWGETRGRFKDILAITEDGLDRTYTIVQRLVQGRWRKYLERFAPREFEYIEDAWAVDSGLSLDPPLSDKTLIISSEFYEDENPYVYLTSDVNYFNGAVGQFVRAGGGIFIITEILSTIQVKAFVRVSAKNFIPEDDSNRPLPVGPGEWSMSPGYTLIRGLHHLEGLEVSILGDGNVFPRQVVSGGQITLPVRTSKAIVGLPFKAVAKTLPPVVTDAVVEGKRKRVVGVAVRLEESRGLLAGRSLEELYEFKNRTNEPYGAPTRTINGFKHILLSTDWDEDGQTYFVQEDPLPASILGLIPDLEFGDDND